MKWIKRLLWVLLFVIIASAIGIFFYLKSLQPEYNAEVKIPGIKSEVEVLFDDYAIPHIYAQNEEDLWQALGYIHAQDRLFQMEMLRRVSGGRLSEVFGKDMLEVDQFFRSLGFKNYAKKVVDSVYNSQPNAAFVKNAKAYVKGINQYIKTGKTPIEFTLAGIPKAEFTLEDSEMIVGYMSYTFMEAFRVEAITEYINAKLGGNYLADLGVNTTIDEPKIPVDRLAKNNLMDLNLRLAKIESLIPSPPLKGSNGWIIGGKKTKSGKPIFSNDTHIGFSQPSVWYEAHLECPGFKFYGNFLAGVPFALLGHNEKGGWGLTMFLNDEMDFYREKINPANQNQFWFQDHWEDLKVREEQIKIKGQADFLMKVRESRHGVLISDMMKTKELVAPFTDQKAPISVFWTYFKALSRNMEACYGMAKAGNAKECEQSVKLIHSPGLNVMWADTDGNIAWWATAKLIKRPPHVNPRLVLDGASGKDEPLGWYDFRENPQILNPEGNVLYTANNQPESRNGVYVPGYYVPVDRAARIKSLIYTDKNNWTATEVRDVINDVSNPIEAGLIKEIIPVFDTQVKSENGKKALEILRNWSGAHQMSDIAPVIYYRFVYRIDEYLLKDEVGESYFDLLRLNILWDHGRAGLFKNETSKWWDNINTTNKETRKEVLSKAFNQAIVDLEKQLGTNMNQWKWEKVHTLTHPHPMGILPLVGKYFNVGPLPVPGGKSTINNLDFRVDSTGKYNVVYGPALRRIVDFGNPESGTSINPTGQSGYFMNKHYDDQAAMFANSQARAELMNLKEIEKVMIGKTVLRP